MEMRDTIKKLIKEMGMLRQENAALRWTDEELVWGTEPSGNKHAKSRCILEITMAEEERCKVLLKL